MRNYLIILTLSFLIINTVNCQSYNSRPWEGLKNEPYINELCFFAKEHKLKKLTVTVPGYIYSSNYISSVLIEFSFDSLNHQLESYKVYFESNYSSENECFRWYSSNVIPKDMSFTQTNDERWQGNLNQQNEDIYGIKHHFFKNKAKENIHHHFVLSAQRDTVFSHWNIHGHKPYYLKYLVFEHSFRENTQQIIFTDYEGEDKNGVYLKEWSFMYDTMSYTSIKNIDEQSFEVNQWDRKYKASSAGGIYLDYTVNGKGKMNQRNWIFSFQDTISISAYLNNFESYPLPTRVAKSFRLGDLKLKFDKVVVYQNSFSGDGYKNNSANYLPFRLDLLKNSKYEHNTFHYKELKFISPEFNIISVSNIYKTCIIEQENRNGLLIEYYFLPKDSTLKEKGNLVMQLVFDKKQRLIERIYNDNVSNSSKRRSKWKKETFSYEVNMLIKRTEAIQKSKRDLTHRKNLNLIRFQQNDVIDYTTKKYLVVNPDDKYDIKIKSIWPEYHEDAELCGSVTFKAEYY